ncbi:PaaI family thioesterase [Paucibacter sp. AS339]|uniref:PaaI family thioesterase n=1 Tax=Paucibacter hankyongi TaxID=3133434 RepID=UPI0030961E18
MSDIHKRIFESFSAQGLMATLGAKLVLVEEGEVHISMPYSAGLSQQHGYLHAGVTASLVDTACGYAALTKAPPGYEVVSAEFKINLMRPALGERFLAIGTVRSAGKLLTVCTGEVRAFSGADNSSYKVVALMQATMVSVLK